jgi:DNA-binding NarL/FixJ family response regulator
MRRSTLRLILGYGGLAALLLVCFRVISLAPLSLDWGRELVAATIAIVAVVVGLKLAARHDARAAAAPQAPAADAPAAEAAPSPTPAFDAASLSPRERGVLELLARGLSNKEIARALSVSENTVKTHLANLYAKLGARRRTEALATARKHGVIA